MKRKIVLWGTNEKEEKILVALHLLDKEGKVNLYTFNENIATEDFYNKMLNQWREGVEVEFPEGYTLMERPLSISEGILPEEIKVDRPDIVTRAQTEWHFVILSSKLFEMYKSELEDLTETVQSLREFDNKIWNEMRTFWSKVQEQVIEKNLFRDHASILKTKTNRLFDHLKALKRKVEEEFEANSAKHKETFMSELQAIEEKIEKGLGLKPIFEELKSLDHKLKGKKFTKTDRNSIWKRLDAAFKIVKEKRFGDKGQAATSNLGRHQRRYDGLINAINKMEKSISRDKDDQKYQDRKIATTDGQLEMQIRQAKIKMIDERVKSKELKLQDMYKTRQELEAKIEKEKQREEKRAKMDEAKANAEAKIAAEMKKTAEENKAEEEKLAEAAAKIKEGKEAVKKEEIPAIELQPEETTSSDSSAKKESSNESNAEDSQDSEKKDEDGKEDKKEDTLIGAIAATMGEALGEVGEALEDVVDTVKAVAEVVEDKIEDAVEKFKNDEEE
ncbi:MAG: hypothetical protein P1U56_22600 [Saprospiraceae bacterium]|nr:hypothetical protein [Saprospiraceae bacterium]